MCAFNTKRRVKPDRFKGQAYTAEQAKKLLEVIHGDVLEPVIMLGLLFGMRRREALGLRWRDIDLEKQTIVISYTIWQCNGKFSNNERCRTPALDAETIQRLFIKAYAPPEANKAKRWHFISAPSRNSRK